MIKYILSISAVFIYFACDSTADIPDVINYQGKVTTISGMPVADGTYIMRFKIFSEATGGDTCWDSGNVSVTVNDGIFSILLGDGDQEPIDLLFDQDMWIETIIEGDIQTPRARLVSVGYAYMASGLVPGTDVIGNVSDGTKAAIRGRNTATTGDARGIQGISFSTEGRGVGGRAAAATGITYGIYGMSESVDGRGVFGKTTATTGVNFGIYGETASPEGFGGYFDGNTNVNGDFTVLSGDVGFGTDTPESSAVLEVSSENKGVLLPRLTTEQRNAISDPAAGLLIFNVDSLSFNYYSGAEWRQISSMPSGSDNCTGSGAELCGQSASYLLGDVSGDEGADYLHKEGCGEGWWWFKLTEDDEGFTTNDLTVTVDLQPPANMDYDLYLFSPCETLLEASTNGTGLQEVVSTIVTDVFGTDDSKDLFLQIVYVTGNSNDDWILDIYGNTLPSLK